VSEDGAGVTRYRIGIVGLGKIAQDQHLPVIAKSRDFALAAIASQRGLTAADALAFRTPEELLAGTPNLDAVAVCTPPQARYPIARAALLAGKHVMLEKPPTATLSELVDLRRLADARGLVLMTTWHSQYNAGVEEAKRRLAGRRIERLFVEWKEDVRKWHPGQAWVWQAGGAGVFDPGVNALSIVTKIMPEPIALADAELLVPENAETPIAANLAFSVAGRRGDFSAAMDWRPIADDIWEISVETADGGSLKLSAGGARLAVNGEPVVAEAPAEYEDIYAHFAELLAARRSHVDAAPFELVADAFMIGVRTSVAAFVE
jgi:D-galactose 1-dehydrogenase